MKQATSFGEPGTGRVRNLLRILLALSPLGLTGCYFDPPGYYGGRDYGEHHHHHHHDHDD